MYDNSAGICCYPEGGGGDSHIEMTGVLVGNGI